MLRVCEDSVMRSLEIVEEVMLWNVCGTDECHHFCAGKHPVTRRLHNRYLDFVFFLQFAEPCLYLRARESTDLPCGLERVGEDTPCFLAKDPECCLHLFTCTSFFAEVPADFFSHLMQFIEEEAKKKTKYRIIADHACGIHEDNSPEFFRLQPSSDCDGDGSFGIADGVDATELL